MPKTSTHIGWPASTGLTQPTIIATAPLCSSANPTASIAKIRISTSPSIVPHASSLSMQRVTRITPIAMIAATPIDMTSSAASATTENMHSIAIHALPRRKARTLARSAPIRCGLSRSASTSPGPPATSKRSAGRIRTLARSGPGSCAGRSRPMIRARTFCRKGMSTSR